MPGCSALGCTNSERRGKILKSFPSNLERRKLWASKVNRVNWTPTYTSRLCEDHFDDNQWEKTRVDGTKKLKCNAVPNIFGQSIVNTTKESQGTGTTTTTNVAGSSATRFCAFGCRNEEGDGFQLFSIPSGRRNEERRKAWVFKLRKRKLEPRQAYLCEIHFEKSQFLNSRPDGLKILKSSAVPSIFGAEAKKRCKAVTLITNKTRVDLRRKTKVSRKRSCLPIKDSTLSKKSSSEIAVEIGDPLGSLEDDFPFEVSIENEDQENVPEDDYFLDPKDRKIKALQLHVWSLQKEIEKLRRSLRRIFTPDQLKYLISPKSLSARWSKDTLKQSLALRLIIGEKGYKYLYKKGHPIPSNHTLQHRIKINNIKWQELVSECMNDPDVAIELSGTESMQDEDETVKLSGIFLEATDENVGLFDVSATQTKSTTTQCDKSPVQDTRQTKSVNYNDENVDPSDTKQLPITDETVDTSGKVHVQENDETLNLTENQDGADCVNTYDVVECNEDDGGNMLWEICIEQDIDPYETDTVD